MADDGKLQSVVAAIDSLLHEPPSSDLIVVAFNERAELVGRVPAGEAGATADIRRRVAALQPANGTRIDQGIELAVQELGRNAGVSTIVLMTDGQTQEEQLTRNLMSELQRREIGLHVVGTDDVNISLARDLTDATNGELAYLTRLTASELAGFFGRQIQASGNITVRNVQVALRPLPGVRLLSAAKAWPDAIAYPVTQDLIVRLGDLIRGDRLELYAEFAVPVPPYDARVHVANVDVSFDLPQAGQYGLRLTTPLVATFVAGAVSQTNPEVLGALHRVKASAEMDLASRATTPDEALRLLQSAGRRTRLVGDSRKTVLIGELADTIRKTRTVSDDTRKTAVAVGRHTKVVS